MAFAELSGAVHGRLTQENIGECDLVLICIYPAAALDFMGRMGPYIGKKPVVLDCCGTKRAIVAPGQELAKRFGFTYVGGTRWRNSVFRIQTCLREPLPRGADGPRPAEFRRCRTPRQDQTTPRSAGFGKYSVTTAEEHDRVIAFTSQLAHVVSNAYVKSPTAEAHQGFSAGSYKDMTRVAWLNPEMWAELFLDNADHLTEEIDGLIQRLGEYKKAILAGDRDTLVRLLDEGRRRKEGIDKK